MDDSTSDNSKTSLRKSVTSQEVHETQENQIGLPYMERRGIEARALKLVSSRSPDLPLGTAKQQHREQWGWGGPDFRPWLQQTESWGRSNTGKGARPALTYPWLKDEIKY